MTDKPMTPEYSEPEIPQRRINTIADLNNGLKYLGFTPGAASASGTTIYIGIINSDASEGTPFPDGWSVSKTVTGRYTITHNLGTSNYVIICTSVSAFENAHSVTDQQDDTVQITFYSNSSGSTWDAADTKFMFLLVVQS